MRSLLLTAAVSLIPSLVHASDIRVSSYEMSEAGGVICIESDAPIGEPWMRTDAHSVRIWFPDVKYVARFDHARDAHEPIRALQLRPGADDSAVLRIDFGPGQKFSRDDVEVTREGQIARVRVRLPVAPAPVQAAATVTAAPKPAPVAPSKALYAPEPPAAPQPTAAAPAAPAPSAIDGIRAAAAASDKQGLQFSSGPQGGLTGLAIISGILLAAYAGIRSLNKKRVARSPDIQVLSARRLGHRSELLVVRALGADHLLVTSAGRVERVASVPTPIEPSLSLPPAPLPSMPPTAQAADSQAEGLGIISKLSSGSRLRRLLDAVEQEPVEPAPASRDSRRPAFGPELLSAIHHHKLGAASSLPPMAANPNANKQSDAVAGIARLRAGTRTN